MTELNKEPFVPDANNRTLRTAFSVALTTLFTLVVIVPDILRIIIEEAGGVLPDHIRLWLLGASAVITALATVITRVMAMPIVNDLLSRYTPFGTNSGSR